MSDPGNTEAKEPGHSKILQRLVQKIETEKEATMEFTVRSARDGDPITQVTEVPVKPTLWRPNISTERPGLKTEKKIDFFRVTGRKEIGTPLAFGGRFFKVSRAEKISDEKLWGKTSVFATDISEAEYNQLVGQTKP